MTFLLFNFYIIFIFKINYKRLNLWNIYKIYNNVDNILYINYTNLYKKELIILYSAIQF
jgi:hypothetical protein